MTQNEMKLRTKKFALLIIQLVHNLPQSRSAKAIGNQLVRSGTSVGSNYRAVCRAKSTADFINKLAIVEEEADESAFWLEMLEDSAIVDPDAIAGLRREADEILRIVVAASKTAKQRRNPQSHIRNPK